MAAFIINKWWYETVFDMESYFYLKESSWF